VSERSTRGGPAEGAGQRAATTDWQARCEDLARRLGRDIDDVVERWAERAAIREHDGLQPRDDAERDAFDEICSELELLVAGPRRGPRSADGRPVEDAENQAAPPISRRGG
jgi:hypothetical protein